MSCHTQYGATMQQLDTPVWSPGIWWLITIKPWLAEKSDNKTKFYPLQEAAQALLTASMSGSRMPGIIEKAQEYLTRVEVLKQVLSEYRNCMEVLN